MSSEKNKYIFIDTNLYMGIFVNSEYDKKIFPIIKKLTQNNFIILMPQQVLDEIDRNRFSKWSKGKNLKKEEDLEKVKNTIKQNLLSEFSFQEKLIKQIDKEISRIKSNNRNLQKRLISPQGRSSKLINELLKIVEVIPDSEDILKSTQMRVIKGNPPYENNNNGKSCDRYIWESLLYYFLNEPTKKPTLYVFTENSNDWCINKGEEIHPFLVNEFKNKLGGKVIFSNTLDDLPEISKEDKRTVKKENIRLQKEDRVSKIKQSLPNKLLISNSWGETDQILKQVIDCIPDFDTTLISEILSSSLQNNDYSFGPYNQVLGSSQALKFFIALFNYSKKINFPMEEWKNFYLQLDEQEQERFYPIRKELESIGVEFDLKELKFISPEEISF
jgi:hypothetical protein